jgi:NAD-dependent deacetylase
MEPLEQAAEWLRRAQRVAILTGAGISAESGIPTFRGAGGLWRNFRAEDLATPEAFARDPRMVWEWYDWRRQLIAAAQPNAGHVALAEWERRLPHVTLITQNVDGLHARAGSRRLWRVHGDIWTLRCVACGREEENHAVPLPELPPRCTCGGMMRPGVVWFGEGLAEDVWAQAVDAAQRADVFFVVGTSARVYPAAGLVPSAQRAGARVVEVNVEESGVSSGVDLLLRGPAAELLPRVTARLA